ncbi:NUMOD4 motif-containing HNH endonuclease [Salmonella enterica]|uniref:NUMOD4 motif-containing HNH endonuclease n=1 Tax=Salmonella enterica TaxID=28901 RepID=UPI000CCC31D0|nr:NUMOD4 motif-containing HNH endonuclease [Salmonella enterica]EBX4202706.1 HNH endonuclease [Salmonella enterica subsp. enterica serovar Oakland]ECC9827545.1 HNH endonuclease [Salmonella enterica subsp. enterica]EHC3436037.1 HNH endonuclease [Salmonella enterica subsp. enterica serovar Ouakam]EAW8084287.1 HNH endonuclease [Salmonella enterica]EBI3714142.1 HNH endonuclease [Salmonella enterica]
MKKVDLHKQVRGQVRDISGFEGRYQITDSGDVISLISGKFLSPGLKPGGYQFVGLSRKAGSKTYKMVHRLVAEAFIPNPEGKSEVNHKDGDKTNNSIENLEWVTRSENAIHGVENNLLKHGFEHYSSKLTPEQVLAIYYAKGTYRSIGKNFGVCAQTVCNIKGKSIYRRFLETAHVQK